MTRKESYATLGIKEGADLAEIKRAYRKLAFSLHPDLNPDVPDAARRFQLLNEAYVLLSHPTSGSSGGPGERSEEVNARAREEARKAYSKARQGQEPKSGAKGGQKEVLKDILNDPFARRVFEDIYSHIRDEGKKKPEEKSRESERRSSGFPSGKKMHRPQSAKSGGVSSEPVAGSVQGVVGKFKGWLRKQIDDEQVLRLPGASLVPGARVRLEIQHGLTGEPQIVELTLPPEFVPGKAMRLKGMGKRLGGWKGDLYVKIEPV